MILEALGIASGLLGVMGGQKKKSDNKNVANAQEKLARHRYGYNIQESNKALEENLRGTFSAYAATRMGVINSVKDEVSKVKAYTSNSQNIEAGSSSFMLDALQDVDNNLNASMMNIYQNQNNNLKGLVQEKVNLDYQLQNNLSDTLVNIKTKQAQLNAQADQEIMNGLLGAGTSAFNLSNSRNSSTASLDNIKNETFNSYLNTNFSSMFNPQRSNLNFNINSSYLDSINNRSSIYTNMFGGNTYGR